MVLPCTVMGLVDLQALPSYWKASVSRAMAMAPPAPPQLRRLLPQRAAASSTNRPRQAMRRSRRVTPSIQFLGLSRYWTLGHLAQIAQCLAAILVPLMSSPIVLISLLGILLSIQMQLRSSLPHSLPLVMVTLLLQTVLQGTLALL